MGNDEQEKVDSGEQEKLDICRVHSLKLNCAEVPPPLRSNGIEMNQIRSNELNQIKSNAVCGQAGARPHRGLGPGRLLTPSPEGAIPRDLTPASIINPADCRI